MRLRVIVLKSAFFFGIVFNEMYRIELNMISIFIKFHTHTLRKKVLKRRSAK